MTANDSIQTPRKRLPEGCLSLASVSTVVVLAAITHAYEFGSHALFAGLVLIVLLCGSNLLYRRKRAKLLLVLYSLLNLWIIFGFGFVNGFWNHSLKPLLVYLHNGYLPPFLASMFRSPQLGPPWIEGAGMLTFALSILAAYFCFKFVKEG